MKPFVLGGIFARGGSKGIPKKNIRPLAGKPLIAYAIETGRKVPLIDELIVSTDDEEIAAVAQKYGAKVPFMRPVTLATDHSPEILSWKHAVKTFEETKNKKVDVLVVIPTTSPLREPKDVESCLLKLLKTDADIVITIKESERNPYFNMVKFDKEGNAHLVANSKKPIGHRQKAPKVFDMTTVAYAVRTSYLRRAKSLLTGKVKAVLIPSERALDIDTLLDFEISEFLMARRGKNI